MTEPLPPSRARYLRWLPLAATVIAFVAIVAVFAPRAETPEPEAVSTTSSTSTTSTSVTTTTMETTTTTATEVDPVERRGGTVEIVMVGDAPTSVHPWSSENGVLADAVAAVTSATAIGLDTETLDPVPVVLAELPSLDNGGLVYLEEGGATVTLRIRPEARWEDGTPITGADFAFTAQTLASDGRVPEAVRARYALIDPGSWLAGPNTVRFDLTARTIEYLALFDPILPSHQMAGTDLFEDWQEEPWFSAGPFRVEQITETGVQLEANEEYWKVSEEGEPLPYLDGLSIRAVPDLESLESGLTESDLVALPPGPIPESFRELEQSKIVSAPGREWEHLAFQFGSGRLDVNPGSLNASETFRTATASLIDRHGLVSEFFLGERRPLDSVVGASWPAAAGEGWPANSEAPADLLDTIAVDLERTFDEPPSVELVTTDSLDRTQFAGAVLQSLASAGIGVEVALEDSGLFFRDFVIAGEFDLAEFAWTATPGPIGAVRDLEERFVSGPTQGGFNFYRWGSPGSIGTGEATEAFRSLVGELDAEMDVETLRTRLAEADDMLSSHVVVVPLYIELNHTAVADTLSGFTQPAGGQPLTVTADVWRTAADPS